MADKSLGSLNEFLDWTAEKGLMAKNTVNGRKAAVAAVLGVLDPEEKGDVTTVTLDDVMTRFVNLHGKKYNPSSLNVYRSRTNAALNDFKQWLSDPLAFKPHANKGDKNGAAKASKSKPSPAAKANSVAPQTTAASATGSSSASANVFPVPIREDVVVRIHGLPFDLTTAEAEKIANVVRAMAMTSK